MNKMQDNRYLGASKGDPKHDSSPVYTKRPLHTCRDRGVGERVVAMQAAPGHRRTAPTWGEDRRLGTLTGEHAGAPEQTMHGHMVLCPMAESLQLCILSPRLGISKVKAVQVS